MAVGEHELDRLRAELETKLTTVTVDQMKTATAISAYGERFTGLEARFTGFEARFTGLEARMDAFELRLDALSADVDRRFEEVNRRFEEVDRRFEQVDRRLDRIESRLNTIESKLDRRFGWQTFLTSAVGALVLFGDVIRPLIGLG